MGFCNGYVIHRQYSSNLAAKLAVGYRYWSGRCCNDYLFHICNWHPLFGICCCHPAHPFTRCLRLCALFLHAVLTAELSVFICHVMEILCIDPRYESSILCEDWEPTALPMTLVAHLLVLVLITLPLMIVRSLLETLMVLDPLCTVYRMSCLCTCLACASTCCKWCFVLLAILSAAWALFRLISTQMGNAAIDVLPFAWSLVQSWILWFPFDLCMPCCGFLHGWCYERRYDDEEDDLEPLHTDEYSSRDLHLVPTVRV